MNTKRMKGCESEMLYRGRVKNKNDEHTKKGPTNHNTTTIEEPAINKFESFVSGVRTT